MQFPGSAHSISRLASCDFFGDLSPETLIDLSQRLEWVTLDAGDTLMRQGDPPDCLYVVISGRLTALVLRPDGATYQVGQIGRGETVGEMALLVNEPRSATVTAVRPTLLAKLSQPVFQALQKVHPEISLRLGQLLARRLVTTNSGGKSRQRGTSIAVVSVTPSAAFTHNSRHLHEFLAPYGTTRLINATDAVGVARDRISEWLSDEEQNHRFLVLHTDSPESEWCRLVLRHCDRVLMVASASENLLPQAVANVKVLGRTTTSTNGSSQARRDLVLLHENASIAGTAQWTRALEVTDHHHVRIGVEEDYQRVARIVAGQAVGLVLGGGGARGYAHIGAIRALREAGICIDFVGGTSMGSVMAAEVSLGWSTDEMLDRSERAFRCDPFKGDYTLPLFGVSTGRKIVRVLRELFGDSRIEDQVTAYFAVSCNLTRGSVHVSREGLFHEQTRSSTSLPGYWPPVVRGGELLVDGAVMNNLPGDIMKTVCEGRVIAVDVSPRREIGHGMGDCETISGWESLRFKRAAEARGQRPPNIIGIVMRTIMLNSVAAADQMRNKVDCYLHPPVGEIDMFDLPAIRRAADIGYRYTCEQLEAGAFSS